jgi:hypothetical protein
MEKEEDLTPKAPNSDALESQLNDASGLLRYIEASSTIGDDYIQKAWKPIVDTTKPLGPPPGTPKTTESDN